MASLEDGLINKTQARSKGKVLPDSVGVFLNRTAFSGWEAISVSKNLGSIANTFAFSISDKFQKSGLPFPFKPGVLVQINIGDERVLTGRVEHTSINYDADDRGYKCTGRTLAGDLVDCSVTGPLEYKNILLKNPQAA